ncbi:MAG: GlsB/YeaQ/YmgE family stress response membrane protein [Propionibacteriaceae bacterium]|jgi:uncharacterized membrane protein YeaQ/YmgE (transglycosylase-associated protein family)|nr:GlsB/YeaQ/YmgE family stress response membrane protein [Propionibacteriaceae bacterium]
MSILAWLILGIVAGSIARSLLPGRIKGGLLSALVCGVVGAQVGGWLSSQFFHIPLGHFWSLQTWAIAIAGSALVLVVWGAIKGRKQS